MTGVERSAGDPSGRGVWRSLFDTYLAHHPTSWLSLQLHGNVGIEPGGALGTDWWAAGAAYLRLRPWPVSLPGLTFAGRGDVFYEAVPAGGVPIFWPVAAGTSGTFMASGTLTARLEILGHLAIYLEGRVDHSSNPLWTRTPPNGSTPGIFMNDRVTATLGLVVFQ